MGVLKNPLVRAGIGFFRFWRNPGDPQESGSGIPIPEPT